MANCIHCGIEIKDKHLFCKCECYSCRSAKEYVKKGDHCSSTKQVKGLKKIDEHQVLKTEADFGQGNSAQLFLESLENEDLWVINHQKQFRDR